VFGPRVEFFTSPEEGDAPYCVMMVTIPPGVLVRLHSHPGEWRIGVEQHGVFSDEFADGAEQGCAPEKLRSSASPSKIKKLGLPRNIVITWGEAWA
jgi:hypothetical protein